MPGSRSRYSFECIAPDLSDCVGVESCVDLITNVDLGGVNSGGDRSTRRGISGGGERRAEKTEREFPPPIPWLASTENLPCFMKRYYTDDGRLVIVEEKIQRQDYFRADRSNGRLTLRLIPIKDEDEGVAGTVDDDDDDGGARTNYVGSDGEEGDDQTVLHEESLMTTNHGNGVEVIGNGGGKFYHQYCNLNLSRNSCLFAGGGGVAVAAVRSVHT